MRSLRLLILTAFSLLALSSGQAAADISVADNFEFGPKYALDGDDFYSVTYRARNKYGQEVSAVIWRQSISGGKRVRIASFRAAHGMVSAMHAGGGRVAVELQGLGGPELRLRIVAVNRNGSGKRILATGLTGHPYSPVVYRGCGTTAWLQSASSQGTFVIRETSDAKFGSKCRRSESVESWRYVAIGPEGRRRTIDAGQYAPGKEDSDDHWVGVKTEGDFAALVREKTLHVYVKNLSTGIRSGPFVNSMRRERRGGSLGTFLGADGMLTLSSQSSSPGPADEPNSWTDVFTNPTDPNTAIRSASLAQTHLCGSRLVDIDYGPKASDTKLREIDPLTLNPIRAIATVGRYGWIENCSGTHVVVSKGRPSGRILRSVPIGL